MPNLSLITVFPNPPDGKQITLPWIQQLCEEYGKDDVFDDAFLANVIFHDALMTGKPGADQGAKAFLKQSGMKTMCYFNKCDLVPGPHVLWNQKLWEVCKLVDDSYETCMVTLKPQQSLSGAFEPLSITGQKNNVLSFAIPSRLKHTIQYDPCIEDFPLAGKRILIKDNIHLHGIKTSNGNRAFYDTYPAQTQTASCIQKLIDRGVVVLGKTKMTSFGNWEEPTECSSSGSASAVAAYDWLDIAIGTDTWGSVTRPAHWCGCFGLRPSIGAISADGIVPCVESWDIPGILARNLEDCKHAAEQWLDFDNKKFKDVPQSFSSVIWPTDFWTEFEATERNMAKRFAEEMAVKFKICLEEISFNSCWRHATPEDEPLVKMPPGEEPCLSNFMKDTALGIASDIYQNGEDFRIAYKELNRGAPYTSKPNEEIWSIGKQINCRKRDNVFARIGVYRRWFQDHVLIDEDGNTISAIIVLPLDTAGPRYRDDCPNFPRPPQSGINALALGPVMEAPVLAVPIGQIPYKSRVNKLDEKLPFAVALMGPPGTDIKLIDTAISVMGRLKIPTKVETGKVMYAT